MITWKQKRGTKRQQDQYPAGRQPESQRYPRVLTAVFMPVQMVGKEFYNWGESRWSIQTFS
jgi:hypothetical protein